MIHLGRFCCTCLKKPQKLEKLSMVHQDNLSYHNKLSTLIPELDIDDIKTIIYICEACKIHVDNMYNFYKTWLENNKILWRYISQLSCNQDCTLVDSISLDKLEEIEILEYVDEFNEFYIEFETLDNCMLRDLNVEERLKNNEFLNVDIKEEIEINDDFNNSTISSSEDTNVLKNIEIKSEDISVLHTEIDVDVNVKNETENDADDVEMIGYNNNESKINHIDIKSPKNTMDVNVNKSSENIISINNLKSDNNLVSKEENKICIESFTTPKPIDHERDGVKKYACEKCPRRFKRNYELKVHYRIHTNERPYKCELCDKSFNQKICLKRHQTTHTGEKPYKCKICNKYYSYKHYHKPPKKNRLRPYKCEICNKAFYQKHHLTSHIKTHSGERPYKCKICNKAYSAKRTLKVHNRIHTGERPYKCEFCDKSFIQTITLKIHRRKHTGERPFVCEICDVSFKYVETLKSHNKIHADKFKPYKCDMCNKIFSKNYDLVLHKRVHTGEKPYTCKVCNKSFSRSSTLVKHTKIHTRHKSFQCDICKKICRELHQLKKHQKIHNVI